MSIATMQEEIAQQFSRTTPGIASNFQRPGQLLQRLDQAGISEGQERSCV